VRRKGEMSILVVEQYFEWARDVCVMQRMNLRPMRNPA